MDVLDEDLRRRDPDRWLSSRFVTDARQRARLVALYSLDGEWARVAAAVTTPLAGEIRLAWWSEALERFAAGGPAEHPALAVLGVEAARRLERLLLSAIDARRAALESPGGSDAADVAVMTAAARLLDPETIVVLDVAAKAWATARSGDGTAMVGWLPQARDEARRLPVTAFPAVAHVTLARAYTAGRAPGALEKRLRITWAVLRGRL